MAIELDLIEHSLHIIRFIGFLSTILWGSLLFHKAYKLKTRLLFEMGITIIGFPGGLTNESVFYIYWLITGEYIPLVNWTPFGLIIIGVAISSFLDIYFTTVYENRPKLKKVAMSIIIVYFIALLFVIEYILFFTSESVIESMVTFEARPFDNKLAGIGLVYLISVIAIGCLAWFHFGLKAINKDNKQITRIKGKFILASFFIFTTGLLTIIFDGAFYSLPYLLNRIIFIILFFGLFLFYVGFALPNFVRKLFNISEE